MNTERTLNAAKDCIKQFLAQRYPLKHVAGGVIAERKLNSKERRVLLDLVFRWCREIFLFDHFLKERIQFSRSMSTQEKNSLALSVFAHAAGHGARAQNIASLSVDYQTFVTSLGAARYLIGLSPFIREALVNDYGDNAAAIAQGLAARPAKYLAYDRSVISVDKVVDGLNKKGISSFVHPRLATAIGTYDEINLADFPVALRDNVWFMDAGSQIIAELVVPKAADRVLDMCAGEGNKARYITMHDCHYVAADVDGARLNKAKARLNHKSVEFIVADGRALPLAQGAFDWILLDAPCSGSGVLRRHPDLMHRLCSQSLKENLSLQRDLLTAAITLLRPNGILIYATCSLFRAENDLQIAQVLAKNSRVMPYLLKDLVGERIKVDNDAVSNNSMTLFPHIDDCDGFFFAALKKLSA